jgi:hypothetical protein
MAKIIDTIIGEIAIVLAKGFLKSRQNLRLCQAGNEEPERPKTGLAFPAEESGHVSGAYAAKKGKQNGSRRIEGH